MPEVEPGVGRPVYSVDPDGMLSKVPVDDVQGPGRRRDQAQTGRRSTPMSTEQTLVLMIAGIE